MAAAKDWTGNSKSTYVTLGASNHTNHDRAAGDYYATDPAMAVQLMQLEALYNVWEPACGAGHLAEEIKKAKRLGKATDLYDRGYKYGESGIDFLAAKLPWKGDIVTNPPYKYALEFTQHALTLIPQGYKVCMFLKLTFLESQARYQFFKDFPPCRIYVSVKRAQCGMNGVFEGSSAACYAWFVWEKGSICKFPRLAWFNY